MEGQQLGVLTIEEAREKAQELDTDLVMVASKATPPVVRLMDLGKHVYEQRKNQAKQKAKSKSGEVKGIRIGFKIGEHDRQIRVRQAQQFLEEGHKVKLEMRLRGREKGRADFASRKMREFIDQLVSAELEGPISRTGGNLSAVLARSRQSQTQSEVTDH
jgi:translation initiation factor IF-3